MKVLFHLCTFAFAFVLYSSKNSNAFPRDQVNIPIDEQAPPDEPVDNASELAGDKQPPNKPVDDAGELKKEKPLQPIQIAAVPSKRPVATEKTPAPPKKEPNGDDVCEAVKVMNEFAFDLQKHVSNKSTANEVFSPYSIYVSLALLSLGARGKTKEQIQSALKWKTLSKWNHYEVLKMINDDLLSSDNTNVDSILHVANNGWVAANQILSRDFLNETKRYFGVEYQSENFGNSKVARERINKWVSDHTGERITELFPTGSIDVFTKIVLANAIYFKGHWTQPFKEENTMPRNFFRSDGDIVLNVDNMIQKGSFNVGVHRNVQLLELPYGKDEIFTMLFAKPRHPSEVWRYRHDPNNFVNIERLGEELNAELFDEWLSVMKKRHLEIFVPKFTLKQRFDLKEKLRRMGVDDVFTNNADLSGISNERNLYLSSALHQAYIEVDEKGTQAAGATGLGISFYSVSPVVELNRPFFFFIINKLCDSVIFAGKVMDP